MPRRRVVAKREILPDPKFGNLTLAKFMNMVMVSGKKAVAERIVYAALDQVEEKARTEALPMFHSALENIAPQVEVRSRRVGGATYQVPIEVRPERRNALAMRWITSFAQKRSGRSMADKLAAELSDAYSNRGSSVKKREDTHKMAEANKAFAHYRW